MGGTICVEIAVCDSPDKHGSHLCVMEAILPNGAESCREKFCGRGISKAARNGWGYGDKWTLSQFSRLLICLFYFPVWRLATCSNIFPWRKSYWFQVNQWLFPHWQENGLSVWVVISFTWGEDLPFCFSFGHNTDSWNFAAATLLLQKSQA